MRYNPDKPLRTSYATAIMAVGIQAFADLIPEQVSTPSSYILIHSQSKVRTAVAKPTDSVSDNFNFIATIVFDINVISPSGFANPGEADDIEEVIINLAENITVNGWAIKSRVFVQSLPLPVKTATNYINRKVVTYQHWMEKL